MKVKKKVIGTLEKCYALAKVEFDGKKYLACAAEKQDPAYLYDYEGNFIEKLWDGPGGVMSMEQYHNQAYPTLLATWKFYSPNDGANSKIVYYTRKNNCWVMDTLVTLPFVHRFGVVERNGYRYIVACSLKSAHAFKDDWSCPGRVWVGRLPDDLSTEINSGNELKLDPLLSGLTKNHGFTKCRENGHDIILVGTDNGIFKITPPENPELEWKYEKLTNDPTSDMLYLDFDGDGIEEIMTFAPFHGDTLSVYKLCDGIYKKVWQDDRKMPFLHAIYPLIYRGITYAIYGYRKEEAKLNALYYDQDEDDYKSIQLDEGAGPTNVLCFQDNDIQKIIAANRETNEIALYTLGE